MAIAHLITVNSPVSVGIAFGNQTWPDVGEILHNCRWFRIKNAQEAEDVP